MCMDMDEFVNLHGHVIVSIVIDIFSGSISCRVNTGIRTREIHVNSLYYIFVLKLLHQNRYV